MWEHEGAGDRLVHEVSEGEHRWYGRGAYDFIGEQLAAPR